MVFCIGKCNWEVHLELFLNPAQVPDRDVANVLDDETRNIRVEDFLPT